MLDHKTLLITGWNENSEQAEVLDFFANESTVLPSTYSFPENISHATGGVINGIPFIIGGYYSRDSKTSSNECRKLTSEGWQIFAQLKTARRLHASVVLQDNQIWVTGGSNGTSGRMNSTEIIDMKTNESKVGPDLPTRLSGHAMVKLNENKTLIIGGSGYDGKCSIYDQSSLQFTPGPEMNVARETFGWGIFSSSLHNGRNCLLVAGGYHEMEERSVEILDFTQPNAAWKISNGLSIYILFI